MNTPNVEAVKLDELNCWRIRHGQAELLVAQQGAHILSYQLAGEPPLIWLNDEAVFKTGKSIRAGVPVCWPWFGNLTRNPQSVQAMRVSAEAPPAHGLVRAIPWVSASPANLSNTRYPMWERACSRLGHNIQHQC